MGNLILRMGIGLLFIMHGYPKVMAGPERWEALGNTMQGFGIKFAPILWGAAASFSEFIGGVLLVIGLLVRPSAFFSVCDNGCCGSYAFIFRPGI